MEKDERENDQVYSPKEAVSIKITTNDEFLPTSAHNISQYIEDLRKVPTNAAIGSPYSEMKEETANLIDLPNKIETIELLVEKEYDEIFHFQLLPGELQKYIFYFFDLKTLCTCSQVCKEWRS